MKPALSLLALCALLSPLHAAPPDKFLVLDPRLFNSTKSANAKLVQGTIEKHPANPLFKADKPWENALNNLYPNVVYDEQEKLFKLWYKCVLADKDVIAKMNPPATVHDVGWFLLYATSRDGIAWEKPELGLIPFDGSTRNNIVARDTPNVGVFKDDHDADPARRYKIIFDQGPGKMMIRFSPDGIHWADPVTPAGVGKMGDTHNMAFWDARLDRYVMISRLFLGERLVYRSESADFLKWSEPKLALRSTKEEGKARQTYCMPSFPCGVGYVGFVMMYNATTDRAVDCELVYSADSVNWTRPFAGTPFIPRGAKGSYDAGCIYAQANPPVERDGKLWIYYGGSEVVHRGWKRHCIPCLATLRPDGYAAMTPADARNPAELTTNPMTITGPNLTISADAAGGSIEIAILSDKGEKLARSEPISANVTDAPINWSKLGDLSALKDKPLRLTFSIRSAKLYSVSGLRPAPAKN